MDQMATMCEDSNKLPQKEINTNCDSSIRFNHWQTHPEVGEDSHYRPIEFEAVAISEPLLFVVA